MRTAVLTAAAVIVLGCATISKRARSQEGAPSSPPSHPGGSTAKDLRAFSVTYQDSQDSGKYWSTRQGRPEGDLLKLSDLRASNSCVKGLIDGIARDLFQSPEIPAELDKLGQNPDVTIAGFDVELDDAGQSPSSGQAVCGFKGIRLTFGISPSSVVLDPSKWLKSDLSGVDKDYVIAQMESALGDFISSRAAFHAQEQQRIDTRKQLAKTDPLFGLISD